MCRPCRHGRAVAVIGIISLFMLLALVTFIITAFNKDNNDYLCMDDSVYNDKLFVLVL